MRMSMTLKGMQAIRRRPVRLDVAYGHRDKRDAESSAAGARRAVLAAVDVLTRLLRIQAPLLRATLAGFHPLLVRHLLRRGRFLAFAHEAAALGAVQALRT